MKINWFATTALAALVGSGAAWAQTQEPQQRHDQRAPQAQQEHRNAAPQAQQERGQPGAQNAQREESQRRAQDRPQDRAQANGPAQNETKQQGNEPSRQNARSEKASPQGHAEQKRASETRKGSEQRNAREENRRHEKGQRGQARALEQNPSGQAQDTTQKDSTQSKRGRSQNTAQGKQPENRNKQNQAATRSNQGNANTNAARNNNASTTNTNTASAKLSASDRTKVFSRLKQEKSTTRESVNVRVSVGERLPSRVHPRRLPADIVTIMPEYRGYDFVMVQDEIAIVRPGTREVVDVIREGGPSVARRGSTTHITLSTDQRQSLLRETRSMKSAQVSSSGPTCLPMQPLPQSIVSQNPDLRGLELIKIGDEAVLVDPKDQKIVDVIRQ